MSPTHSSLMADQANSSSKLSVASRASQCHGISQWPIGIGFALSAFSFSFTDSLFSSPEPKAHR